jgi:hypothetical protein
MLKARETPTKECKFDLIEKGFITMDDAFAEMDKLNKVVKK